MTFLFSGNADYAYFESATRSSCPVDAAQNIFSGETLQAWFPRTIYNNNLVHKVSNLPFHSCFLQACRMTIMMLRPLSNSLPDNLLCVQILPPMSQSISSTPPVSMTSSVPSPNIVVFTLRALQTLRTPLRKPCLPVLLQPSSGMMILIFPNILKISLSGQSRTICDLPSFDQNQR